MAQLYRCALLLSIVAAMVSFSSPADAQTRRIRCGENAEGHSIYREVYEYDYVDCKPSFPGGDGKLMCFINKERHYPEQAYNDGVQGRVVCSFVVNTDGSISNIEVLKGVCYSLNNEAVRILSRMPNWNPGKLKDQYVPVRVIHTVTFRR